MDGRLVNLLLKLLVQKDLLLLLRVKEEGLLAVGRVEVTTALSIFLIHFVFVFVLSQIMIAQVVCNFAFNFFSF